MRRLEHPWAVSVIVEGLNLGRFVRNAGKQGIQLTGLRRTSPKCMTALVQEDQLQALQEITSAGGWKLTRGTPEGIGRIVQWTHGRWLLTAAVCIGVTALVVCSQIVWRIEIIGGGTYQADIAGAVSELGVRPPMLRRQLDIGALRDALEWRYPRLAWVECGWRGTALVIRPVMGMLPDDAEAENLAMDVVAERDGVVHHIVTVAGTPVVQSGDVVREGEVLIRGEERTAEGEVKPVAARGSVTARVWMEASVRMPAMERITKYTGVEDCAWTLRSPWFDLWSMETCSYDQYDTAVSETMLCGIFFPVKLHTEKRMEAEVEVVQRETAMLEADAYAAAVHKLKEKAGGEESLIDIWGNCSMIDAETMLSVAVGEMLTEIGKRVPASGMAAPAGD
nr:sporulation protein YqfD [Clostridia bacterium]